MKVETDIITCIAVIQQDVVMYVWQDVVMYVKTFNTDIIVFIIRVIPLILTISAVEEKMFKLPILVYTGYDWLVIFSASKGYNFEDYMQTDQKFKIKSIFKFAFNTI